MRIKLFILLLFSSSIILSDMIYDPLQNIIYSSPLSSNIDQSKYVLLLHMCTQINDNMAKMNNGIYPSYNNFMIQTEHALKTIGTPTALRLLADLKKGKIFYPNGSVAYNHCCGWRILLKILSY